MPRIIKFLSFLLVILLISCSGRKHAPVVSPGLPRPQPGYTGWLEKQSLLNQAGEYIAEVSQSGRLWLYAGNENRVSPLLLAAPNWLEFNGLPAGGGQALFRNLSAQLPRQKELGFTGAYLGSVAENQDIWHPPVRHGATYNNSRGIDAHAASFSFADRAGTEEDFDDLAQAAENSQFELGANVIPAATSFGPDFLLQARNATGHNGVYAMLAVPVDLWPLLPEAESEWDCQAVPPSTMRQLADKGIAPEYLQRDTLAWANSGGWAVTGPVKGTDGQPRRWLYRFDGSINIPVLLWQDPSGQAKKIFSASIIQNTGLRGLALAGLRLQALMGMEPKGARTESSINTDAGSPGMEALEELAVQIHRYGGWALQADCLPSDFVARVARSSCDFCRDALTPAFLMWALLNQDVSPLMELYRYWQDAEVDFNRLAHGFNAGSGINTRLLHSVFTANEQSGKAQSIPMVENMSPRQAQDLLNANRQDAINLTHFILTWEAGLPGLFFVDAQLPENVSKIKTDIPQKNGNFLENLPNLLRLRRDSQLALGKVNKIFKNGNLIAVATTLPSGDIWLVAANFDARAASVVLDLPQSCIRALNALDGGDMSENLTANGRKFALALDAGQVGNVIFYRK